MKSQRETILHLSVCQRVYATAAFVLSRAWDMANLEIAASDPGVSSCAREANAARLALFSAYADAVLAFSTCHTPGAADIVRKVRDMLNEEAGYITMIEARFLHTSATRLGAWASDLHAWTDQGHYLPSIKEAN